MHPPFGVSQFKKPRLLDYYVFSNVVRFFLPSQIVPLSFLNLQATSTFTSQLPASPSGKCPPGGYIADPDKIEPARYHWPVTEARFLTRSSETLASPRERLVGLSPR